eukprot:NODE_47_length_32105_cov_1.240892.p7 type:complete len:328 gc:universal NODE_47_length_32105_cov_1.240892:15044-16027(+)
MFWSIVFAIDSLGLFCTSQVSEAPKYVHLKSEKTLVGKLGLKSEKTQVGQYGLKLENDHIHVYNTNKVASIKVETNDKFEIIGTENSFQIDQLKCQIVASFLTRWVCSIRAVKNNLYSQTFVKYSVIVDQINSQRDGPVINGIKFKYSYTAYDQLEISSVMSDSVVIGPSRSPAVWIVKSDSFIRSCEIVEINQYLLLLNGYTRNIPHFYIYFDGFSMKLDPYGNLIRLSQEEPEIYAFIGANVIYDEEIKIKVENMVYIVADSDKYYAISTSDWKTFEFEIEGHFLSGNENAIQQRNVGSQVESHTLTKKFKNSFELASYLKIWKQ